MTEAPLASTPDAYSTPGDVGNPGGSADPVIPPIERIARQSKLGGFVFGEVRLSPSRLHGGLPLSCISELGGDAAILLSGEGQLADFDPCRALFFDLETTGLPGRWDERNQQYRAGDNRRGSTGSVMAFLVGTIRVDRDGTVTLRQYLLRQQPDEPAALEALAEALSEVDFLVSFNGKAFDRNVLADRFARNRRDPSRILELPHLDLLHPSRRLYSKVLSRCSLGTLEAEVLGLSRPAGEIPGSEVPIHWERYLATGNTGFLEPVLDHNTLDLLSLVTLGGHLARCVTQPDATLPAPGALAEAARLMLQRGEEGRGERLLRRLIGEPGRGEAGADLDPVTYGASWVLAEHLRRGARHDEALPLLLAMCDAAGAFDLRPWRAAAIALERRMGRPGDALQLIERALDQFSDQHDLTESDPRAIGDVVADLLHRRARLQKRLARVACQPRSEGPRPRTAAGW